MQTEWKTNVLYKAAAIVGIGQTDWVDDHRKVRSGNAPFDSYGYAAAAFTRALTDGGLSRDEVDGLVVGPTTAYERMGEILGINPRFGAQADAVTAIVEASTAIACGLAEVVALVYGNNQRSGGIQYGGPEAMGGDTFLAYVYHTPWGLTSQGALYALMWRRYMALTGPTERDLGLVAVSQRQWASRNPNAIMRKAITLDDYMAAPYIADPLRLFDYCLVNDGGVALIIAEVSRARAIARVSGKQPVLISAVGRADLNTEATSLGPRLRDFYRPAHRRAAQQLYEMVGFGPKDVDALMVYDSFSCHVPLALEGFGFCDEGDASGFIARTGIGPGGKLPVNTGGGHLSESYMQGWNHQIEAVRQIRGEAGDRQIERCRNVQYASDVAGKVVSLMYER
jgi:acetyl-CoA acetyltransferase